MGAAAPGGSQRETAEAGLRFAVGTFAGLSAVTVGARELPVAISRSGLETVLTLALLAAWVVVTVRGLRGRGGMPTVVALMVTAFVPLAVIGAPAPAGLSVVAVTPTALAAAAAVLLARPPWNVLIGIAVIVGQAVVVAVRSSTGASLLWAWPAVAMGLFAVCIRQALVSAADRADRAVSEQRRAQVALARARAQTRAHVSWQGVLHDEVAAALRAASTPGVARLEARRSAREAVAAVESLGLPPADGTLDVVAAIHELAGGSASRVEVAGPVGLQLPARVATAVVAAVSEALRNVDRHAGTDSARVLVSEPVAGGVEVTVRDDGAGFVLPSRLRAGGLRLSVVDRLGEVGGSARIDTGPGTGTTVVLRWVPEAGAPVRTLGPGEQRLLAVTSAPLLAAAAVLAAVQTMQDASVPWLLLVWFAAVCVMTAAVGSTRRALRRRWAWAAAAFTVGGMLVQAAVMPAEAWTDHRLWPFTVVGPLLLLLALTGATRVSTVGLVVADLGLLVVGVGRGLPPGVVMTAMVCASFLVVAGAAVAAAITRLSAVAEQAGQRERGQVLAAWERAVYRQLHRRRQARLEEIVLPFLREVADGSVSTEDERVRAQAVLIEQAVRDELHLPEVLDSATRELVAAARAAGCRVRFQADAVPNPPFDRVCALVAAALTPPHPHELTVSLYLAAQPPTMAVVAVPGDVARGAALREVAGDAVIVLADRTDATWAEVDLARCPAAGRPRAADPPGGGAHGG